MFEIELTKGARPSGGAFITAFPSVGMVGTIAGNFIVDSLKMERIAYVLSDEIPPAALVHEGVPTYPLRILAMKRVSIMTSEFQIPLALSTQLAKTLLEWTASNGYDLIVGLEGLMSSPEPETTGKTSARVFGVGSTEHAREMISKSGVEQFKMGMITGVSGAMLSEGERTGRDVICLLVEANAMYPDARGAARLVESVTRVLPSLQMDLQELLKEAVLIEENVKDAVEKTKEMLAARQSQTERLGRSYMYG